MPLYYGHPVTQSKQKRIEVSPALKEQGIELLRAVPSQVHTFVLPFVENPLWSSFIIALSALLYSLAEGQAVSLNLAGYRVDHKHPTPLPIKYPDLCIQVLNPSPKVHQWLLDNDFEEQEIRGGQYYLLSNPSSEVLQQLLSEDCPVQYKDANYVPLRFANMGAIFVFSEMVNILSFGLQALSASLWAGPPDRRALVDESRQRSDATTTDVDMETPEISKSAKEPHKPELRLHAITRLFQDPTALAMFPSSLLKVDASPLVNSASWTNLSAIYQADDIGYGLVARYIPDLSDDDPFGVPHFFSKYLHRSLGNTAAEIINTLDRFKSAWGILKSTSAGHILSHLVKSMEIAIEANCAITAIFDQEFYEGVVIQGLGFLVSTRNGEFVPLGPEDLQVELGIMETHRKAYSSIKKLMISGRIQKDKIPDEIEDMDALRLLLLKGAFSDEQREEIKSLVRKLRFPVRKWSINIGTITRLLDTISKGSDMIDRDYPIGPEAIFSNDPLEIVMSCFNTNGCPSFRHPSGVPVNLRQSKPPTPPSELKRKGGRGPQQVNNGGWIFSVRRVDYNEAVTDFRVMIREGEARSMSSSAARGLGYFVVSGGNFEKIFMKMKECLSIVVSSGVERSGETDLNMVPDPKHVLTGEIPEGASKRQRRLMI